VTTLAPLPGRDADAEGAGTDSASGHDDMATLAGDPPVSPSRPAVSQALDLTSPRHRPAAGNHAAQASWVFGLALALLSEGTSERVVTAEVLAEAAGRPRALEGAYGRGVALLSEYPGDPLVQSTVDLLAKALLRSRRPARTAEEA
jgi:hypothetical protein